MKIKTIKKPILFFQLSKIVEKISRDIVETFSQNLLVDLGRVVIFRQVGRRTAVITDSRMFDKTLSSSMLAIDGQMTIQVRHDFLNNGENK